MAPPKTIDLDKKLGLDSEADIPTRSVNLFGRDVRVSCGINQFGLMGVVGENATSDAVIGFIESMIHPADWPELRHTLTVHPALRGDTGGEKLMEILMALMEVAAEPFPTKQPSDLPRGVSTRSTSRKSAASTGSGRVTASKRSR